MITNMLISIIGSVIVSFFLNELVYQIFKNKEQQKKKIKNTLIYLKISILLILTTLNIIYSDIFNFELMMFLPGVIIHMRFSQAIILVRDKISSLLS